MAMLFRSFKKNQLISLFKCFQQQQQILLFSKHRVTIGEMPSKPNDEILKPMSLETANSKQLLHDRIYKVIERFKQEEGDTGSAAVQIAVMTERIQNLARHFAGNKKDFGSRRGFQLLVSRRRSMMKYLKRTNFDSFRKVILGLDLRKEASEIP